MTPTLILASNSPRRRHLLALTGWAFSVRPVDIDERPLPDEPPAEYVLRLAASKARAAGAQASPGDILLTADTTVADGPHILGKPEDASEARAMLRSLRGRAHMVYTAIGVFHAGAAGETPSVRTDLCATRVWMRDYSDAEIEVYIASGDPFDKAGGYAIQNETFQPVERIEGCYACVVGLPVCHVVRALSPYGLQPAADVAAACAHELAPDSPCPVFEEIYRASQSGESGGA
jgi:MAF protein